MACQLRRSQKGSREIVFVSTRLALWPEMCRRSREVKASAKIVFLLPKEDLHKECNFAVRWIIDPVPPLVLDPSTIASLDSLHESVMKFGSFLARAESFLHYNVRQIFPKRVAQEIMSLETTLEII
jgi:hypothetical protein